MDKKVQWHPGVVVAMNLEFAENRKDLIYEKEYKSPEAHLNIDSFYKLQAYAALYKAYKEKVDARKADDITVSIVRKKRPEGLFRYFKEKNVAIENLYQGIYFVKEKVLFPTQIIVTQELDKENHM